MPSAEILFLNFFFILFCVPEYTKIYVDHLCARGLGDQEMVSYTLKLELQGVVSHHVGLGSQTQVLCKGNKALLTTESFSAPWGNNPLKYTRSCVT